MNFKVWKTHISEYSEIKVCPILNFFLKYGDTSPILSILLLDDKSFVWLENFSYRLGVYHKLDSAVSVQLA